MYIYANMLLKQTLDCDCKNGHHP